MKITVTGVFRVFFSILAISYHKNLQKSGKGSTLSHTVLTLDNPDKEAFSKKH